MAFQITLFVISTLALSIYAGPAEADLSTFDITQGGAYKSSGTTQLRFIFPNKTAADTVEDAFFAIDPVAKVIRFSQGRYGSIYVRPTAPSYATYPLPNGQLICGVINADYDLQLKELSMLTQKGKFKSQGGQGGAKLLTDYSGYASEIAQCGQSIALGFKLDSDNRVRFVSADTPYEPIGRGKLIVSQYMDLPDVAGVGDGSVFDLDPICLPPYPTIPWCNILLPNGPFALYDLAYFHNLP
jgi:hypothetical protein